MRTRPHMIAMLAAAAGLAAIGAADSLPPAQGPRRRQPYPKLGAAQSVPLASGGYIIKPPMNGKREVARRLRQIERGDVLNHPTVAARELVFTP